MYICWNHAQRLASHLHDNSLVSSTMIHALHLVIAAHNLFIEHIIMGAPHWYKLQKFSLHIKLWSESFSPWMFCHAQYVQCWAVKEKICYTLVFQVSISSAISCNWRWLWSFVCCNTYRTLQCSHLHLLNVFLLTVLKSLILVSTLANISFLSLTESGHW